MQQTIHQYIDRQTNAVKTETLFFDNVIALIYSTIRENASLVFNQLISARTSALIAAVNYDFPILRHRSNPEALFKRLQINHREIYGCAQNYDTYRKIFERKICYWQCRPMDKNIDAVVSPADSRILAGSFYDQDDLFIKEKFFNYQELIGQDKKKWLATFKNGNFAIFRLTPDKYHYNHCPVSGKIKDIYEINGRFHSCNPGAVIKSVTPYSKNQRVVTVIDTDVPGGSAVGKVAMIEVAALMIGQIAQKYSAHRYDPPQKASAGLFISKGQPKSLFRPGSSTTILIFEKDRIQFDADILANMNKKNVSSRFSNGFGRPMVETDLRVRETIARRI